MQRGFVRGMDIQLGKLIQRFQARTKHAHEKLNKLAKLVGKEVQEDVQVIFLLLLSTS